MKKIIVMMIGLVALAAFQPVARADGDHDLLVAVAPCAAGLAVTGVVANYEVRKGRGMKGGDLAALAGVSCVAAYPAMGIGNAIVQSLSETPDEKALNEALDSEIND